MVALEVVLAQGLEIAAWGLLGIPARLMLGTAAGAVAGFLLAKVLASPRLIPQGMESVLTLALLLALYAMCEAVLPESGIMAAPIAGIVVGNMPTRTGHELREFKEQLTGLLSGLLFVLLAADVRLSEIMALGRPGLITVALLMFLVRPLAVAASAAGSTLTMRARAFIAWLGPRGIVAAAVASLFAQELGEQGAVEGIELRALVFLMIAATVVIQGLGGGPMARLLGVSRRSDTGYLIAGAGPLARALGKALQRSGEEVVLVDTDRSQVAAADAAGLEVILGDALDDELLQAADIEGRRGLVGLIPNEAVGLLVAEKARREYRVGRADVAVRPGRSEMAAASLRRIGGHVLFGVEADLSFWTGELASGRGTVRRYRYTGDGEGAIRTPADRTALYLAHERIRKGRSRERSDPAPARRRRHRAHGGVQRAARPPADRG